MCRQYSWFRSGCTLLLLGTMTFGRITVSAAESTSAAPTTGTAPVVIDNEELKKMFEDDQADRGAGGGKMIDGEMMRQRDEKRRMRLMEIYRADQLQTGPDYFHAAMLLQHGDTAEDYLLAHELCVAALALGHQRARWLAAATEDRFLKSIGQLQRFGTQYSDQNPERRMQLDETDDGVTDALRQQLRVPSLAAAKGREAEMAARRIAPTGPRLSLVRFGDGPPPDIDVLDLPSGDKQPEIITQVTPLYPPELQTQGIGGQATILFVVERDGTPSDLQVGVASRPEFGEAALVAVSRWTFKPALKNGQPARVMVATQIVFAPSAAGLD